ncbi:tRNA methyltransferase 10 homolog C [Heteronotia binoei]|uniref:tRNA methyltransferase 10 homolog C n=1 Tax=Heteronotia binoei TaxID=13085 RepID=UPI00292EF177|nr:tRNA methyltransferase 10 homolog C [Heteronotia binoei]XP_060090548.1 tRNA methyltransferase 10 homolog C [Heteronotia binoei]
MNIFNKHLFNVRRLVFPLAVQDGIKRLFFIKPCKLTTCRTFVWSPWLSKDSSSSSTEKLDLDGWKHVVRSVSQEETGEKISENDGDSSLAATRELIEMWRLLGKAVPGHISEEQFKILMECPSKTSKRKYLTFLAKKEATKRAEKEKREKQKQIREEEIQKAKENNNGEAKNTFLMKFWSRSEDTVFHWRAAQSMIFGQPLVYDMTYENYMSHKEMENAVKQMMEAEGINRKAVDPFHLHYCNLNVDGPYYKLFLRRYGEAWDKLFVTMTKQSYVEVFPQDQLVYLTADSPNVMERFEHDKIYIIGSLVDKSIQKGVSLAQAKRLKLATARLPLDEYLHWEEGAKNLTLDQMMQILMSLKDTGDWMKAFQFVPRRKHSGFVSPSFYSKLQLATQKKMRVSEKTAGQEKASSQYAKNSIRQQIQRKWWEDVS